MNVLVCDPISAEGIAALQANSALHLTVLEKRLTESELIPLVKDTNAIIVRSETKITKNIINAAPNLKVVGRAGVGVDNVDVAAATEAGVLVMNTPSGNTLSAAELTCAHILALARKVPQANASMKAGKWDRKLFKGRELYGKTLGVLGMGRIGSEVATRMMAFGMKVITFSPVLSPARAKEMGVKMVEMDEVFRNADFITFHVPLTDETRGMVNARSIQLMKKGVFLVNCSRGGVIVDEDLVEGLKSGQIGGAALDVFSTEPLPVDSVLRGDVPNLILTPHLGASTVEAQIRVGIEIAESIGAYLTTGEIRNAINLPEWNWGKEEYEKLKPYMLLGTRLGKLAAGLAPRNAERITITFGGKSCELPTDPVSRSVLTGYMEASEKGSEEGFNCINIRSKAALRGLDVKEQKSSEEVDYNEWIRVAVQTQDGETVVSGTFFGSNMSPRIVRINNYHVETVPEGIILAINNIDKPGVIAKISMLLCKHNVNIANMTLNRNIVGGQALTVLNLDSVPPAEMLEELGKESEISSVRVVQL